jgi:peptidyl-dipeptidase A
LDPYFKDDTAVNIVKRAEAFYQSMGFAPVPESFWTKSDLFPAPPESGRQKNSHASAWHVDRRGDVRSLMSVENNAEWFFTSNHELGHIHYYIAYSRPEVPSLLREGANRAFHEGVGELISLAAGQVPYLREAGILPPNVQVSTNNALLVDALERTVAFMPWSAGVMTHFEYELYEKDLPPDQWQKRWWEMVNQYQGVVPPDPARISDPEACDACTKTHIIDDPAGYYDYAIATVIKFQLHRKICRDILHQDVHSCNYSNHKEVGAFLTGILEKGATQDWRVVLKDATGEEVSTQAMVEYFKPLHTWLSAENKRLARQGRK